jgi:hypothetical protein
MVPDRGFKKQLATIDHDLEVVWDWGSEVWEIWHMRKDGRKPYLLTRVTTKDKTYRELGADVLLKLQQSIQMGPEKIIAYLEEQDNQIRRRKMANFKEKIKAIALDTRTYLAIKLIQVPQKFKILGAVKDE